jgi:DNA-binding IclR family transcriptional regulator
VSQSILALQEVAAPFLDDLVSITKRHIQLAVPDEHQAVVLDRRKGKENLPLFYHTGDGIPLISTAVGRVLLTFCFPQQIDDILASARASWPLQDSDPPSSEELRKSLNRVRLNEISEIVFSKGGIGSIAVPIKDHKGTVIAALGLVYDSTVASAYSFTPLLRMAALGISKKITAPPAKRKNPDWGKTEI